MGLKLFMNTITTLRHQASYTLPHGNDVYFLGTQHAAPYGVLVYAEEITPHDEPIQHVLTLQGEPIATHHPIDDPPNVSVPSSHAIAADWVQNLNFLGVRHRGLMAEDRIRDMVLPLSIAEKIQFAEKHLPKGVLPPHILGIAERYVLAVCKVGMQYMICQRLRVAYALPTIQQDADHLPYDYDTIALYGVILVTDENDILNHLTFISHLDGIPLHQPTDCLCVNDVLLIADRGDAARPSQIHLWNFSTST